MAKDKLFRDVLVGDTVYIYDRTAVTLHEDKVTSVSDPYTSSAGLVVDVAIGKTTYIFRACSPTGYTTNLLISTGKEIVLNKIKEQQAKIAELLNRY